MTLATLGKIMGLATLLVGGPISIYCSWDHITLYANEREVLKSGVLLGFHSDSSNLKVFFFKKGNESTELTKDNSPWTCTISIKSGGSITDAKMKEKLPMEEQHKNDPVRNKNKELLVRACARKKDTTSVSNQVRTLLDLPNVSNDGELAKALSWI